jgi:hypothetical protein
MKKIPVLLLIIGVFLLIFFMINYPARAVLESFGLDWWTVDSGGGQTSGDSFTLYGVAGQPDARTLYGGDFNLAGGFLSGDGIPPPPSNHIFVPLIINQP